MKLQNVCTITKNSNIKHTYIFTVAKRCSYVLRVGSQQHVDTVIPLLKCMCFQEHRIAANSTLTLLSVCVCVCVHVRLCVCNTELTNQVVISK